MAKFTVHQGKRYHATIVLSGLESWAGNETIADRLRGAGFAEVVVSGSGGTRVADALWPGPDTTAEMPSQIRDVKEMPTPPSAGEGSPPGS